MSKIFCRLVVAILKLESRLILYKYKPKIVAITGSVGKTSTKDIIYTIMSGSLYVRKSEKSYNTEFGVPLTIIGRPNSWNSVQGWFKTFLEGLLLIILPAHYPKWLVLEMGADAPGDIERLVSWVKPDIAILSGFGSRTPVHVEFFNSPEHVYEEKAKLLKNMNEGGVTIINGDEEKVRDMAKFAKGRKISYGFNDGVSVRATLEHVVYDGDGVSPIGMSFRANVSGKSVPVKLLGVVGRGQIYAALGAVAVSEALGLNLLDTLSAIEYHQFPPGRGRLVVGKNGSTIIDESYNSSPSACKIALENLRELQSNKAENIGRKIIILGDMAELGRYSETEHENIGKLAARVADRLYLVGEKMRRANDVALSAGMTPGTVKYFDNSIYLAEHVRNLPEKGDLILVKGSQSMRLERVVEALMAEPSKAPELLVRQEIEWKRR